MRMMFAAVVAFGAVATWPAMAQAAMPAHGGSKAMPEMCKSMGMAMGMMDSKMGDGKMGSKMEGMPMAGTAKAQAPTAPDGKAMSTAQMKEMKMSCGDMMGKGGMPMAKPMPKGAMPKGAMPDHE